MTRVIRRDFLKTVCLSLTGMRVFPRMVRGSSPDPPLGVRWGVRSPFTEESLHDRALLLSRLGYQGLELGPEFLGRSAESILAELKDTAISISAIVGSLKLLDPDPTVRTEAVALDRKRLEMARILGAAGVIEVPTFGPCRFPNQEKAPAPHRLEDQLLVEAIRQLKEDLKRTRVDLFIEPLTRKETHYMNLQSHGARIIEEAHVPGVKLLSDFYHMQMEERDITAVLGQYGRSTGYVHLADGVKRTEPGSLPFDYRPGFRALKRFGFSGWLTVESGATDNPESALQRALHYLQRQWLEA